LHAFTWQGNMFLVHAPLVHGGVALFAVYGVGRDMSCMLRALHPFETLQVEYMGLWNANISRIRIHTCVCNFVSIYGLQILDFCSSGSISWTYENSNWKKGVPSYKSAHILGSGKGYF
jgi:hypothetical protein